MADPALARNEVELQQAEEKLRDQAELFGVLTENTFEFIRLFDAAGNTVYSNSAVSRLLGEVPAKVGESAHPEDRNATGQWFAAVLGGSKERLIWRVRSRDGDWRWMETQGAVLTYRGSPHVLTVCRDITHSKQGEEQLRQNAARSDEMLDTIPIQIWSGAPDGKIDYCNDQWRSYTGLALEQLQGHGWQRILHPDDRERALKAWGESVINGTPFECEERHRRADGTYRWFLCRGLPLRGAEGRIERWLGANADVEDRKQAEDALRESERKLIESQRLASIGYWERDLAAGRIAWSEETGRIFKMPEQGTVSPTEFEAMIHPDDRVIHKRAMAEALEQTGFYDAEYRIYLADGEERFIHVREEALQDESGRPVRMFGTVQDVTARRRAEQDLRRTAKLLQAVIDGTTDAVFVKDRSGRYLLCNEAAARFMGRTVSEVLGKEDTAFFDPVSAKVVQDHDERVMKSGDANTEEEELTVGDTTRIWLVTKAPYRDERGSVIGIIGISRDITERKRMEIALRAAEERLQHVVGSSPAVLFTLQTENGKFRGIDWLSPNIEAMLGYRVEEALGSDWWLGNIHPEDRETVVNLFLTETVINDLFTAEYRFRHKDGSYRWIRGEIRLLRNKAGQPAEAIGSLSDITERKLLEDQFQQAQKMEVVGHLAGGVAHDFNNLLAVILGCCQILENKLALGGDSRELVEEIYKAADRATSLTKQLLAFSRRQILRPELLNLNEVVTESVAMLDRLIGEDITIKTNLNARLWPVKVDGGQMNQVIMNLAVNARDAMPHGGTLTIETSNLEADETYSQCHQDVNAGSYVMLVVSDTGTGMDEHTKSHIFEPFFTTKGMGKGTGLGLATVFGIVNQSEGHVTVASELGKGTTFKVYLPRHEIAAVSGDETNTALAPRGAETILVAEDEEMLRKLAFRILSSQGYKVLQAADGEEALRVYQAQSEPIQLLLADVVMPKMNGRQLYDKLSVIQPGLKVLYTSGYTDDAILRHGVLESNTNFIEKPFTYAALATAVRRALDGK